MSTKGLVKRKFIFNNSCSEFVTGNIFDLLCRVWFLAPRPLFRSVILVLGRPLSEFSPYSSQFSSHRCHSVPVGVSSRTRRVVLLIFLLSQLLCFSINKIFKYFSFESTSILNNSIEY